MRLYTYRDQGKRLKLLGFTLPIFWQMLNFFCCFSNQKSIYVKLPNLKVERRGKNRKAIFQEPLCTLVWHKDVYRENVLHRLQFCKSTCTQMHGSTEGTTAEKETVTGKKEKPIIKVLAPKQRVPTKTVLSPWEKEVRILA